MRIALLLVLLLATSARPASAQHAHLQPAQPALPVSLTPAVAPDSTDPRALYLRRDHARGAQIGSAVGAVAGALVGTLFVCKSYSDGDDICTLAGIGLGALVGAVVGGIIGVPDRPTR